MTPADATPPPHEAPPRTTPPSQRRAHAVFGLLLVLLLVAFLAPIAAGVGAYLFAESFETLSPLQTTLIGSAVAVLAMFTCNLAIMMPMAAMAGGLLKEGASSDTSSVTDLLHRLADRSPHAASPSLVAPPVTDVSEARDDSADDSADDSRTQTPSR